MEFPKWDKMPKHEALLTKSWEDFYPEAHTITQEKWKRDPFKEEITEIFQRCDSIDCEYGTYWSTVEHEVRNYYQDNCNVCGFQECKCEDES